MSRADPLGVRAATAWVMERARDVRIVDEGVRAVAERLRGGAFERQPWRTPPHWWDDARPDATAHWVLLLDALNFSFWGQPRWRVAWQGQVLDGYWALAACLRRALEAGEPLHDPRYLAHEARAETLLAGLDGTRIPLLRARQAALVEVGRGIMGGCDGAFLRCVERAEGRVGSLVQLVEEHFPSFRDVAEYEGQRVPLYKRAQILVSDLWGAFEGRGPGAFEDLDSLTMFADYKVPQVLHGLGVLAYSADLEGVLRAEEVLPHGDPREVEIRAASVQAVERICDALEALGSPMAPFDVDWRLWEVGQGGPWPLPYHRVRCVAY